MATAPPLTDHFVVNEMDRLQREISIATQLTPSESSLMKFGPSNVCFICVTFPQTLLGVNDFVSVIRSLYNVMILSESDKSLKFSVVSL